jgi:hypothetical protein
MKETEKTFSVFGIDIDVKADSQRFLSFLEDNLYFFRGRDSMNERLVRSKKIALEFTNRLIGDIKAVEASATRMGNNAYLIGTELVYFLPYHMVRIARTPDGLSITCGRYSGLPASISAKRKIKDIIFKKSSDHFPLARELVVYPALRLLEEEAHIFSMHASAVNYEGRGVIFAGLASCGKTTAALSMVLDAGAKFLSDNFLPFNKECIFPFPEYLRLSPAAKGLLKDHAALKRASFSRFKRDYYRLERPFISGKVKPSVLYMVKLTERPCLEAISRADAADRALLAVDHVREFPQHHYSGLIGFLSEQKRSLYEERVEALQTMLRDVKTYELGIPRGRSDMAGILKKMIDDALQLS